LIEDFNATYRWLDERAGEPELEELQDYNRDPLFLNVDDPAKEWDFETATNLIFNAPDNGSRRRVKGFLGGFKDLLLSAGAHEIKSVSTSTDIRFIQTEEALANLRRGFIELRRDGHLMDVAFKASDGKYLFAHGALLAAQSNHFRTLLAGEFVEAKNTPIYIETTRDYDSTSLESVLGEWYPL
jgi:BTB/POZ domain